MWYEFKAYNSETLYGYTDRPAIAEAYCDQLNRNREINVYAVQAVTDKNLLNELDSGVHAVFNQDTSLDDVVCDA